MVRWLVLAGLCQLLLASAVFGALPMDDKDWYQAAIIYQLYPRSFQDTDGDGIGDLKGVLQRIDYLAELGIDAVWFSPIHPSPNEDFGYDISDFTDINPEYGTLQDFDELVAALKKRGIRTILDFVPNHSSTEHEWFKRSENNETDYADLYVWKNAKGVDRYGNRIPPNNWLGVINTGSAWEWSEKRQQYYLHNFLVHQADLNYRSPVLRQKMLDVLSFWLRRGVDGFRVDAVSWFVEDAQLRDEPRAPWYDPMKPNNYNNLMHIYTMDQEENFPIIEDWRELFDSFSGVLGSTRVMITESYSDYKTLMKYYGVDRPGATFPFNFLYVLQLARVSNATAWEEAVNEYYRIIGDHAPNWVLGNHDQSRVVNKWGGEEWVDILNMVLLTLRGTAITYYGEEIGLENSTVRWDQAVDMQGKVAGEQDFYLRSRDFERNPMPWSGEHLGGFTTGPKSWVPLAPSYWRLNVEEQQSAERSHLKLYQRLAQLRKTLTLSKGSCVVKSQSGTFFYVIRSYPENPTYITVVNLGSDPAKPRLSELRNNLPSLFTLQASSTNFPDYMKSVLHENEIVMPPKSAIVIST